jgi:preprotein translocase subunit SecB
MTPAPLQLLDYWATTLRMEACSGYDPDKETELDLDSIVVENEVKLLDSPDPEKTGTQWLVGLSIEQGPCDAANIPYTFSVTLQGTVLALPGGPDGPDGERLERAVKANAPAMLFGAAREMIRALTSRGPHRAIIIPSTNFLPPTLPETPIKEERKPAKKAVRKRD